MPALLNPPAGSLFVTNALNTLHETAEQRNLNEIVWRCSGRITVVVGGGSIGGVRPAAADRDRRLERGDVARQQGGLLLPGDLDLRALVPDARPLHHHRLRPQVEEGVIQHISHQRSVNDE